jgi:signal transduction histidine kinase
MKLRTKTIITVALLALTSFIALQTITYFILEPSYLALEQQESIEKINQATSIITYRLSDLTSKVKDYAFWDDSYNFVQNQNSQYVINNFGDSTFENLNLNLIAIVNNKTSIIYYQSYDLNASAKIQTSQETQKTLISDSAVWNFQSATATVSGLMVIDGKPMLVATALVLTSQEQGPAEGELLFGRYLDSYEISELSKLININFSVSTISDTVALQGNNQIANSLTTNDPTIILKENGSTSISGYTLIKDIHSEPTFILKVTHNSTTYIQSVWVGNFFLVAAIAFSFFFGLFLLVLLEREIVKPMRKLAAYVEEISLNTNSSPPPVLTHASEEIAIVTNAVRDTLKRKFEGMNEVSRMVAHDLRNPLAGIRNASFVLKKRHGSAIDESGQNMLQIIDECVVYSDKIVQNLLDYSSEMRLDKIDISPRKLVANTLSKFILPNNITLINETSDELLVTVDPTKIEQVFTNLLVNAFDAMPNGGPLKVTNKKVKGFIQIDFSDTGVGMSKVVLEHLWLPFFTTKAKGMGVGLSICKRIVDAHQGRIEVQSVEGNGSCFSVFLPAKNKT